MMFTGANPISSSDIILFSEGGMYRYTNTLLLQALAEKRPIHYLSLDSKDPLLGIDNPNVKTRYLKPGLSTWLMLSRIQAELFITTTPGLNSLALKRSPKVKHYSYYMHSPGDMHWYQKYSFDSFDSICCNSQFQLETLDAIEKTRIYGFSYLKDQRNVLGLPYYDHYVAEYNKTQTSSKNHGKPCVLIATNWGENNFLNYLTYDIFHEFLSNGYCVIFRPHPQSFKADSKLIQNILAKYQSNPNFTFDQNINFLSSLKQADIMVSSISGIIFDFALLTQKPVVIVDFKRENCPKKVALEGDLLNFNPWESAHFYKDIGISLSVSNVSIVSQIGTLNKDTIKKNIQQYQQKIANFGSTIPKLAKFYLTLADQANV